MRHWNTIAWVIAIALILAQWWHGRKMSETMAEECIDALSAADDEMTQLLSELRAMREARK